jgi:hypothetical protein
MAYTTRPSAGAATGTAMTPEARVERIATRAMAENFILYESGGGLG